MSYKMYETELENFSKIMMARCDKCSISANCEIKRGYENGKVPDGSLEDECRDYWYEMALHNCQEFKKWRERL